MGRLASEQGTKQPICAIKAITPACRMKVLDADEEHEESAPSKESGN